MHAMRRFSVCSQARLGLPLFNQPRTRPHAEFAPLQLPLAPRLVTMSSSSKAPAGDTNDLAAKHCLPCNSKEIRAMSELSARELLEKSELGINGWDLGSEGGILKLHRSWKVKSFIKGLEFFKLVADVAEAEGHHPDLHLVGWNNIKIDLWTHSVGGLTENDFILAAKINTLHVEHLLRRKAAGVMGYDSKSGAPQNPCSRGTFTAVQLLCLWRLCCGLLPVDQSPPPVLAAALLMWGEGSHSGPAPPFSIQPPISCDLFPPFLCLHLFFILSHFINSVCLC